MNLSTNSIPDAPPVGAQTRAPGGLRALRSRLKTPEAAAAGQALLLNAVLFGLLFAFAAPVYETNDDMVMQGISSGFYSGQPDEHLVFTNVAIGWVLRVLYGAWSGHNWYRLYLVGIHFIALSSFAFLILRRRPNRLFVLLYIAFFVVAEMRILLLLQFTTTAFVAGAAGLFLLADGFERGKAPRWGRITVGFLLLALMILVREQVAPFLALVSFPFLIERFGVAQWKRLVITGLACGGLFLVLTESNRWYYQRDKQWAEYLQYNRLRGEIQGTPPLRYSADAAVAAGWTKNDAAMFNRYYFADPEVFGSVAQLGRFSEKLKALAGPSAWSFRFQDIPFLPGQFVEGAGVLMEFSLLGALWCVAAAGRGRWRLLWTLLALYGVFLAASVIALCTARLPQRVSYNMPFLMQMICLYWTTAFNPDLVPDFTFKYWPFSFGGKMGRKWCIRLAASLWVFWCIGPSKQFGLNMQSIWNAQRDLKCISQEILPSVQALLPGKKPVFIAMPHDSALEQAMVFYPDSQKIPFLIMPQGWLTHSPIFYRALDQHRLQPYSLSLLDREDVFFIMEARWIELNKIFYHEHYGLAVRFDKILDPKYDSRYHLKVYQAHVVATNRLSAAL